MKQRWTRFWGFPAATGRVTVLLMAGCGSDKRVDPTYDQAVDQLLAQGYPQSVVSRLNSFGDSDLGFRLAGAPAEKEAASYLASEFSAIGLSNVRVEGVPVDAWTLKGATLAAGGREIVASQFPGIPGTSEPLTAPIVYVGKGAAADYEKEDVAGKLVLVDIALDEQYYWNLQGHEATVHGAVGVVFTRASSGGEAVADPDALYSEESRWGSTDLPAVFVSGNDGAWLKERIAAETTSATLSSDVDVTMHDFANPERGGLGHNVVGEIPGNDPEAKAILVSAHFDAYFRPGLDNTGSVAQILTIAKAMMTSRTRLERPIIFLAETAEEFGYTDTDYDYLAGVWYAATKTHASDAPEPWTGPKGRVALNIDLEDHLQNQGFFAAAATPDLLPWWASVAETWKDDFLHYPVISFPDYFVYHDGFAFTAAGVPAMVTFAETLDFAGITSTNQDTAALIDYGYLGNLAKFYYRLIADGSTGLLPHDLAAQAAHLSASVARTELEAAGADAGTLDALVAAVQHYENAAAAYADRKKSIGPKRWAAVNAGLFALERYWYANLTGIDAADSVMVYPHEQALADVQHLKSAIDHLQAVPVDAEAALTELRQVALTETGTRFSAEVYKRHLGRHLPDYDLLTWGGGQLKQAWRVDIMSEVHQVEAGDYVAAIAGLDAVVSDLLSGADIPGHNGGMVHMDGLNERLVGITDALEVMTAMVADLD